MHVPERFRTARWAHALLPRSGRGWGVVTAGFSCYIPGPGPHPRQSMYSMHYVVHGTNVHTDENGTKHEMVPGDFFEFRPEGWYSGYPTCSDDFAETVLIIDRETYVACVETGMLRPRPTVGRVGFDMSLLTEFDDLITALGAHVPSEQQQWPLSRALAWVDRLYSLEQRQRAGERQSELVQQACRLLSEDLHTRDKVEGILAGLGVSYEFLRKYFRAVMGMSPGEYRIRRRLDEACLMLYRGGKVRDIAAALGYADPFVFSDQFRTRVGMPPSRFRRMHGGGHGFR